MEIKELQREVDNWVNTVGVRYFDPLTNTILLAEEVGEFSSLMAREYGEQSYKISSDKSKAKERIADEIGDIIFVITCLANQMGIDLETAINKNIDKKNSRDSNRHKNNTKLL